MKVIGYIRVSTDEQGKSGLGLESQQSKIEAYCNLYEHELVELISESASGKDMKRHGLLKALDALKNGDAEAIIVSKLDRLSRSIKDMGYLLESYFEKKYALLVVQEQVDTSTATGRLIANVLMSVAQWEREVIGERTRDALAEKKKNGLVYNSNIQFGYTQADGRIIEDPGEQAILKVVMELHQQSYNYSKIARNLNDAGYRTKKGSKFFPQTVKNIILATQSI